MTDTGKNNDARARSKPRERLVAALLIFCVVVVAVWEVLWNWSRRPFEPFQINGTDLAGFKPGGPGWSAEMLPTSQSRYEANLLACLFRRDSPARTEAEPGSWGGAVLVRLVHGYNMPDCMRIKHYQVELIEDTRKDPARTGGRRVQIWRLTSQSGERSIWISGMLQAGDMSETEVDVRSMAYPKVSVPDDPGWVPRGVDREFLKHPVRDFRRLVRTKWNNANCDWTVFLKLRQRAFASDEMLTLVAATEGGTVDPGREKAAIAEVLAAHGAFREGLARWKTQAEQGAGRAVEVKQKR